MELSESEASEMSPLVLAYVGDAVWELHIRAGLVSSGGVASRVSDLHRRASMVVNADAQSRMVHALFEKLSPEEQDLIRRGRNTRPGHVPKGAGPCEYRYATGFEALIGFMYLTGRTSRLQELLSLATSIGGASNG
ncbi:MAG: ribonuclease III domain-containing protein [Clostridia bacterium]|nr:ribonuclease III domain-containing protein [Clostridia bacterium]